MQRHDELLSYALNRLKPNPLVKQAYLFGSCARGDEAWSSDVDLLIVVKDTATNKEIHRLYQSCMPEDYQLPDLDMAVYRESSMARDTFFLSRAKKDWRLCYENLL